MLKKSSPTDDTSQIKKNQIIISGSTMTGSVLGLGYIGYFIDTHYNTNPYGVLIGLLLGVTVGMYELLKIYISKK